MTPPWCITLGGGVAICWYLARLRRRVMNRNAPAAMRTETAVRGGEGLEAVDCGRKEWLT